MTDISYQNAITRDHRKLTSLFEVIGSILAMVYAMSIAMNIGAEMLGFSLLLVSSALFSGWTIVDRRWTFLVLQVFYAASAIIWLIRWAWTECSKIAHTNYTAEDVGSYKPSDRNFDYMLETLARKGISKKDILHTAESMFHDHGPANQHGLANCWIYRRHEKEGFGATMNPGEMPSYDFCFNSMAELAAAHKAELSSA